MNEIAWAALSTLFAGAGALLWKLLKGGRIIVVSIPGNNNEVNFYPEAEPTEARMPLDKKGIPKNIGKSRHKSEETDKKQEVPTRPLRPQGKSLILNDTSECRSRPTVAVRQ